MRLSEFVHEAMKKLRDWGNQRDQSDPAPDEGSLSTALETGEMMASVRERQSRRGRLRLRPASGHMPGTKLLPNLRGRRYGVEPRSHAQGLEKEHGL